MRKCKNGIILGLAAFVLIFCGMLPAITTKVEDYLADNKVYYEDIKKIQLFRELLDIEKMFLLKTGSVTTISEDNTKLKSENMREIVEAALKTYFNRGLIKGNLEDLSMENENIETVSIGNLDDFSMECEPLLYYSNEVSNLSGFFWKIKMELCDDLRQSMNLYLDDQTGKVLLISYECLEPIYDKNMLINYAGELFADYQTTMNWLEYDRTVGEEEHREKYGVKSITYSMYDMVYGEINIKFMVTESGFSIYIE